MPFTVNLSPGTYSVEWMKPDNDEVVGQGSITASTGSAQRLTPPFHGDAVVKLEVLRYRG